MTKVDLIGIPLKKATEVDILKPLKNLIASRYQTAEQESYVNAINELAKIRTNAVCRQLDIHEKSLDTIYRYYDQLAALETKIPPGELQVPFKWKDAFDKGSIFGGRVSLTLSLLSYEKVCTLFNVASLQTQVASAQTSRSDDGLKTAAKLLQSSAGIYLHLKDIVHGSLQQEPTPDLQPDTLTVLYSLALAQAQEVITRKAIADAYISDRMKEGIIAKLCNQCAELYSNAFVLLVKETLAHLWESDWIAKVSGKLAGYEAMAHYYESRVCSSKKSVGEEIAHLKVAIELFKTAQAKSGGAVNFTEDLTRCQQYLADAVKDNDFIYHERVPDGKNLAAIGKAAVAKATPMADSLSIGFVDLFATLVPVVVQQSLAQFELRKQEIVNGEVAKMREGTQLLNSVLASLNLPAALEDTSGSQLPQSLREKTLAVGDKGGIKALEKLLKDLPDLLTRNRELLNECERLLKEEKESDYQLKTQFKDKWTRMSSDKLTTSFQANADKYRKVIETAVQADSTIREKFDKHHEGIKLLSQGPEAMAASLPSGTSSASSSSPAVVKLKNLMEKVETIKAERDAIESEIKNAEIDMRNTFVQTLSQSGSIDEPNLSVETLGRVYGPLQKQVKESLSSQEQLIAEIQKAHMEFSGAASGAGSDRESVLKKLASAYDAFIELHANLQEGTKFYNDLTQLLVNFQVKINDFCFARKTEKEELMKDLTQGLANANLSSAPEAPSHHQEAAQNPKVPPPRPPPPQATEANPYAGAPNSQLPYPVNPQMPVPPQGYPYAPYYPTMPPTYNPYFAQPGGYPGTYPGANPQSGYQQPYPGYPYPGQNQWQPPTS